MRSNVSTSLDLTIMLGLRGFCKTARELWLQAGELGSAEACGSGRGEG